MMPTPHYCRAVQCKITVIQVLVLTTLHLAKNTLALRKVGEAGKELLPRDTKLYKRDLGTLLCVLLLVVLLFSFLF